MSTTPNIFDIVTSISLGDGAAIVVKYDPSVQVGEKPGRNPGSTTYTVPVVTNEGKLVHVSGGARLVNALRDALTKANVQRTSGPVNLKIRAIGRAGTLEHDWLIEVSE